MKLDFHSVLRQVENEDGCGLCDAHTLAAKLIPEEKAYQCPSCKEFLKEFWYFDLEDEIIGETNGTNDKQALRRRKMYICECGQRSSLELQPIQWNANHDVHYDGGDRYLTNEAETQLANEVIQRFRKETERLVQNYVERVDAGENLNHSNLSWWLQSEIEAAVATILNRIFQFRSGEEVEEVKEASNVISLVPKEEN